MFRLNSISTLVCALVAAACVLAGAAVAAPAVPQAKSFGTPEEAAGALAMAAKDKNKNAVLEILGRSYSAWILTGDDVADDQAMERFATAYAEKAYLTDGADKRILMVGLDEFPFPFPLVQTRGTWSFDAEAGKEEVLNRRIGQNELSTIEVLRAVVDAQREYALGDLDGNGTPDYAMKFVSAPGKRDGLYWPTADGAPQSPLGPLVGEARASGYGNRDPAEQRSYHGYLFKLLTRQGRSAEGGAYDYVVRGRMIGGFAVVAFPARYGITGLKTFMVSHDGVVYETDLGRSTALSVAKMTSFDPGSRWTKVAE